MKFGANFTTVLQLKLSAWRPSRQQCAASIYEHLWMCNCLPMLVLCLFSVPLCSFYMFGNHVIHHTHRDDISAIFNHYTYLPLFSFSSCVCFFVRLMKVQLCFNICYAVIWCVGYAFRQQVCVIFNATIFQLFGMEFGGCLSLMVLPAWDTPVGFCIMACANCSQVFRHYLNMALQSFWGAADGKTSQYAPNLPSD